MLWIFLCCVSSGFKKANFVSMSKAATENDKNVSTNTIAATFENNLGPEEVSGERVWSSYDFSMQGSQIILWEM